jgi:hypothetical protein
MGHRYQPPPPITPTLPGIGPDARLIRRSVDLLKDFYLWAQARNLHPVIQQNNKSCRPLVDYYKRDFCTFKLGLPRRSGNTSIAIKLMSSFAQSVAVVQFQRDIPQITSVNKALKDRVCSVNSIPASLTGRRVSAVIVDAWGLTDKQINNIYQIDSPFFCFLGI